MPFSKEETDLLTALRKGEDVEGLTDQSLYQKAAERGRQFVNDFEHLHTEEIQNRSMIAIGG